MTEKSAKAKPEATPSFVAEYDLVVKPEDERVLLKRFEAARCLYNSVLGESLNRLQRMKESKAWQAARKLKNKEARNAAFHGLALEYGFTGPALSAYTTKVRHDAHWEDRIGGPEAQKVCAQAFRAAQKYGFGKQGRPRFKGQRRGLHSMEGKSNVAGIVFNAGTGCVTWMKLVLPVRYPPDGKGGYLEAAARCRAKYCRILWRIIDGARRWYLQVVREGESPLNGTRATRPGSTVGLDVGPSHIAIVSATRADYVPLCPEVVQPWREIRRLQNKLDRSRRATNPHLYNPDGTPRKGARQTVFSANYREIAAELAELQRRLRATRDRSHRQLANAIIREGNRPRAEKLSYKAFQKRFGRSTQVRGVGKFMSILRSKAESAGGGMLDLNTRALRLSQYDHPTGTYTKKPLNQRWHALGDGSGKVQRDVYSAFLGLCANAKGDQLCQPAPLRRKWKAAEPLLRSSGWYKPEPQEAGPSVPRDAAAGTRPTPGPGQRVDERSPTADA